VLWAVVVLLRAGLSEESRRVERGHDQKLLYIAVSSMSTLRERREAARKGWMRWLDDPKIRGKVDAHFHIVYCTKEGERIVAEESMRGDVRGVALGSPREARGYRWCKNEWSQRWGILDQYMEEFGPGVTLPPVYRHKYMLMMDDDGFLCLPTILRDLEHHLPPARGLLWGVFDSCSRNARVDSKFYLMSTNFLHFLHLDHHYFQLQHVFSKPQGHAAAPNNTLLSTEGTVTQAFGLPLSYITFTLNITLVNDKRILQTWAPATTAVQDACATHSYIHKLVSEQDSAAAYRAALTDTREPPPLFPEGGNVAPCHGSGSSLSFKSGGKYISLSVSYEEP